MNIALKAETGRAKGSRPSNRLRAQGRVPAVVYGMGHDPVSVSVPWPELRRALTTDAGMNALFDLEVDGDVNLGIIKELQRDPVRNIVTHVDFLLIDANVELEVEVPVTLIGDPKELHNEGGLIDHLLYNLLIKARPDSIPTEVTVDISTLTIGDSVRVSDIVLPAGVTTEVDPEDPVASAYAPRVVTEAEEGAEGAEGAEGEEAPEGEGGGDAEAAAPEGDSDS